MDMGGVHKITIRLTEDGTVGDVEMEGLPEPEGVTEEVPNEPVKSFGDENYQATYKTWWGG